MKKLICRFSRVADSSQYYLLRSESRSSPAAALASLARRCSDSSSSRKVKRGVPQGHLPVYVGEEMERFVVSAELLNHPVFVKLLNKSAQEYGYGQEGVLRIPCHVLMFERVLEAVRVGGVSLDADLIDSLSDDFC